MNKPRRMTILMLPNDMILNCLARVRRSYYPSLSLVCKTFRSLLASTELYQTRILLGCTESCLYVCLRLCNELRWFTLWRRNILVPISSPFASWSDVAMVGHDIYIIGGSLNNIASSSVMVIDCRSHTLREAPSMQIPRVFPSVCVLDGKIYVTGSCTSLDSTNWMEVFDTKTQTWEFLHTPSVELWRGFKHESVGYDGTIYVLCNDKHVSYKLNKGRWRATDLAMNYGWNFSLSYCVIDNVFYRCDSLSIKWYDPKQRIWKTLEGLENFPSVSRMRELKMTGYSGKMVVLWEEYVFNKHQDKLIWCAEIAIEKRQNGEMWGTLDWFDVVSTTINEPYSLVHVLATTI